jgi:hypothetical protein
VIWAQNTNLHKRGDEEDPQRKIRRERVGSQASGRFLLAPETVKLLICFTIDTRNLAKLSLFLHTPHIKYVTWPIVLKWLVKTHFSNFDLLAGGDTQKSSS